MPLGLEAVWADMLVGFDVRGLVEKCTELVLTEVVIYLLAICVVTVEIS